MLFIRKLPHLANASGDQDAMKTNEQGLIVRFVLSLYFVVSSHVHFTRRHHNKDGRLPFGLKSCTKFAQNRELLLFLDYSMFWLAVYGVTFLSGVTTAIGITSKATWNLSFW